jgi:hypothetical protein
MKYKEEYINYMIEKISTLNLKHFDIVKESLEKIEYFNSKILLSFIHIFECFIKIDNLKELQTTLDCFV